MQNDNRRDLLTVLTHIASDSLAKMGKQKCCFSSIN
ncbi:hypothetical protein SLEP1_g14556 [Rubroshorea leprosula]|uniref:Uncharacterized protein n=1 Tax=Rubroshorea leprosula TaxID=152421 RepID=A0AAV5IQA9_9ROSI|nr:hypothetical protein SLEP1_g14556 [Rubroshorea leprosula]